MLVSTPLGLIMTNDNYDFYLQAVEIRVVLSTYPQMAYNKLNPPEKVDGPRKKRSRYTFDDQFSRPEYEDRAYTSIFW